MLSYLQAKLSPRQFQSIRSLELCCLNCPCLLSPLYEAWFRAWEDLCSILKTMRELRHLQIWSALRTSRRGVQPTLFECHQLLCPLMDITGLQYFSVSVPSSIIEIAKRYLQTAPFTLEQLDEIPAHLFPIDRFDRAEAGYVCTFTINPPTPESIRLMNECRRRLRRQTSPFGCLLPW